MRRFFLAVMVVVAIFLRIGTGSAEECSVMLKLAGVGPAEPGDRTVIAVEVFRDYVETKTGGSIRIVTYHSSRLGSEKEILEGLSAGTIEMGILSTGPIPALFKPIMVFDIPYLFPNKYVAWEVLDGPFGQALTDGMLAETGIRSLAISENGYSHFFTGGKTIRSPEDMRGLRFRTMGNPAHMRLVEALGAFPVPLPLGALRQSLEEGTVDGAECPVSLIAGMKFYEIQKNVVLDGHLYNPLFLFVSEKLWKTLEPGQQQILFEGAQLFKITQRALTERQAQEGIGKLRDNGMAVYVPTAEEMERFRSLSQPAVLELVKDQAGQEWVDGIFRAVQEASRKEQALLD